MEWDLQSSLKIFSQKDNFKQLKSVLHGLERETLRVTPEGKLALTPHPPGLGDKLENPEITADFSESQPELITKPYAKLSDALSSLQRIHKTLYKSLQNGELLWPMSMPCTLPPEKDIPLARFGPSQRGEEKEIYRRGLEKRYGKMMQMISGVHHNFSFTEDFWKILGPNTREFIDEAYLHLVRNFIRNRWILVYLTGASPSHDPSLSCKVDTPKVYATSLRLSSCGYANRAPIKISYNSYEEHLEGLTEATSTPHPPYTEIGLEENGQKIQLNNFILQLADEYYFPIRLKPALPYDNMLNSLKKDGVKYIEIRSFDIDPLDPLGISAEELQFNHVFLVYCLLKESPPITKEECEEARANKEKVAVEGRKPDLTLSRNSKEKSLKEWGIEIIKEMEPIAELMDKGDSSGRFGKVIKMAEERFLDPQSTPSAQVLKEMDERNLSFVEYGVSKAKEYAKLLT